MATAASLPKRTSSLYTAGRVTLQASVVLGWGRALLGAGAALLIAESVDLTVGGGPSRAPLLWLAVLFAARAALSAVSPITDTATAVSVESDLRIRILDALLRIGPWSGRRTGETVTKATEGVEAVGGLAGTFLPQLITGMTIPLLLAVVVAIIDWPTGLVLLLVLPLIPLLLRLLERRFASVSGRYRETADQLAARFLDGIQGMRTLKTLDQADAYGDSLAEEAERLRGETMALLRVTQLALLAVDTLFTLGTVVAAAGAAMWRIQAGAISTGEAVSLVLLGVALIEPMSQIGRFFYVGAIGRAAAAQIEELLGQATADSPTPSRQTKDTPGLVEFDGVSFTYPGGIRALQAVTFRVEPGEKVALIGPSGAGKTTIAHIALGLLGPQEGAVAVGGPAVLVPQRPYLFHGSVADNLRLADPEATDSQLWVALEAADLAETVRSRLGGLDTQVGERGLQLSGGEVQRLAIARAFLVAAPVVVLDEPTSNVDLESEARLRSALDRLTAGRTLMVIAHRRSTVAGMDRALVLDRGRLVEAVEAGPS
ncbi:MAG: ATP-binding cassette domain-containing protein [Actinobacteria bacterium]|nr:ATP-binding cassette domain-containing protein [Actinomycetota bacterium]